MRAAECYDALQISLRERNFHGLVLGIFYNWGKTLSDGSVRHTENIGSDRNSNTLQWLNPTAFGKTDPCNAMRFGDRAYNAFLGPGGLCYEASLHKHFALRKGRSLNSGQRHSML